MAHRHHAQKHKGHHARGGRTETGSSGRVSQSEHKHPEEDYGKKEVLREAESKHDAFKKGGKVHGKKHKKHHGHHGKHGKFARGGRTGGSPFSSAHKHGLHGDA